MIHQLLHVSGPRVLVRDIEWVHGEQEVVNTV